MAEFAKVASIADIPKGSMKGFTVSGKQILVANVNGKFYAIDAICSHSSGFLPRGKLDGYIVTCPVHRAQFDVISGKVKKNVNPLVKLSTGGRGATDLKNYETKVEWEKLLVKV